MNRESKRFLFYVLSMIGIVMISIGLQIHFGGDAYRHITWIDFAVPTIYGLWWNIWGEEWLFP